MFGLTPRRNRSQGESLATRRGEWGSLQEAFEDLFDRFVGQWPVPPGTDANFMRFWDFTVKDNENEIVVRAEMPGFDPKDVDVQLNDNVLTIKAESRQEGEQGQTINSFYRTVTLPSGIAADKVDASYRNGVLELHLPRNKETQGRRIPVREHQEVTGQAPATGQEMAQGKTLETGQGQ